MAAKCADSGLCSSHGALATVRQLLFPCERVGDDRIEILELRAPRQCRVNSFDICHERRRITRPAARRLRRESRSRSRAARRQSPPEPKSRARIRN